MLVNDESFVRFAFAFLYSKKGLVNVVTKTRRLVATPLLKLCVLPKGLEWVHLVLQNFHSELYYLGIPPKNMNTSKHRSLEKFISENHHIKISYQKIIDLQGVSETNVRKIQT